MGQITRLFSARLFFPKNFTIFEYYQRVEVSDASGNTYRVTSSSAVDIASATKFYIALPAGTYTPLNIYDNNWQMVSKTLINASGADPKDKCSVTYVTTGVKGIKVTGAGRIRMV